MEETPFEDDGYTSAITSPIDDQYMHVARGAINGAKSIAMNPSRRRSSRSVASIDDHVPTIEEVGGEPVVPKGEVSDMGYYAYFEDPERNVIGLWETMSKD